MSDVVSADGWPNFELDAVTTPGERRVKYAIRDSFESYWEYRASRTDLDTEEDRQVRTLVFHVDVNTKSTCLSAFADFVQQQYITDPKMKASDGSTGLMVVYNGRWRIQRVSAIDEGNGTSRVTISCQLISDWL